MSAHRIDANPTVSAPLESYLESERRLVDEALARYLPAPPACPEMLHEAMRYSLLGGGKRFRPVLTLAAARAVTLDAGEAVGDASPAACAIECIHTYSLIHDDLPAMDNDTLRRGRPTSHVVFGEGLAILAGDGLLTEAFALLAKEPPTRGPVMAERKLRTLLLVAEAAGATGMVGGQVIDLEAAGQIRHGRADKTSAAPWHGVPPLDAEGLRGMHTRKTGALIRAAAMAGAIMAGAGEPAVRAIAAYGTELGLAFQIVDDILDVEGADAEFGKTPGKDAAAGKPTYVSIYGVEQSRRCARDALDRALGALAAAGIEGRLGDIARWVVARTH